MYGDIDDYRALTALRSAFDAGVTLVDASDGYGTDGHNERIVGRALRGRRDEVAVATKLGFRIPEGAEAHRFPVGFAFGEMAINAEPQHVRRYARNLGVEVMPRFDAQNLAAIDVALARVTPVGGTFALKACQKDPRCGRQRRSTTFAVEARAWFDLAGEVFSLVERGTAVHTGADTIRARWSSGSR